MTPFHLAFRIDDIETTRRFYADMLGCVTGREAENWIDFDFFGHQISAHVGARPATELTTLVGGTVVPLAHFGAVLEWTQWQALADRLTARAADFIIAPQHRFVGAPGEQATFFVRDPSGNALEFKAFRHAGAMFDASPATSSGDAA